MLWPEVDIKAQREVEDINIDRGLQQKLNNKNLWLNVSKAQRKVEDINIDRGLQQTLNTKNLWLNVIITHSKFISSLYIYTYFQQLFQFFSSLYRDDKAVSIS